MRYQKIKQLKKEVAIAIDQAYYEGQLEGMEIARKIYSPEKKKN